MDLEERSIEHLPDRCQNCGTRLTDAEKQGVLERGSSRVLCAICAAEELPAPDQEVEEELG
jgi:hypothetical protein